MGEIFAVFWGYRGPSGQCLARSALGARTAADRFLSVPVPRSRGTDWLTCRGIISGGIISCDFLAEDTACHLQQPWWGIHETPERDAVTGPKALKQENKFLNLPARLAECQQLLRYAGETPVWDVTTGRSACWGSANPACLHCRCIPGPGLSRGDKPR